MTTQKTQPKSSNTQRLRTDLGRSVVVAIVTQLVWLTVNILRHFYAYLFLTELDLLLTYERVAIEYSDG